MGGYSPQGEMAAMNNGMMEGFDGGGVLAGNGGGRMRISPPQFKGGADGMDKFTGWKKDLMMHATFQGIHEIFAGEGTLPDVGRKGRTALVQEGFPELLIAGTTQAWQLLFSTVTSDSDKAVLRRALDPRDALAQLDAIYNPSNNSTTQGMWEQFSTMKIKKDDNPVEILHKLEAINANLSRKGGSGRSGKSRGRNGKGKTNRCYRCKKVGHFREDCTTEEEDFEIQCEFCLGYGHSEEFHKRESKEETKEETPTEQTNMVTIVYPDGTKKYIDDPRPIGFDTNCDPY